MDLIQNEDNDAHSCAISPTAFLFLNKGQFSFIKYLV